MKLQKISIPVKNPLLWLYVGGGLLLIGAVLVWCFKISADPERAFWATFERGLSARGVTIEASQENAGSSLNQTIRYSLGADNYSQSRTVFDQGKTKVVSEMLGTPTKDYTRYISIKTDQKKKDGGEIDFSGVVGAWAKEDQGGNFFSQSVLGGGLPVGGMVVPIGHVDREARAAIMQQTKQDAVYAIDFSKTKKERVDGRLFYTYEISIQPVGYVAMIKRFSQQLGLHALDQLEPADYKGQQAFKVALTVDVYAQQVVAAQAVEGKNRQTYSGYGISFRPELPAKTITATELQKRLSNLQ